MSTATGLAVDPREANFAIHVGDPLVVDVDGRGSGWSIIRVGPGQYVVYRDEQELTVPWTSVRPGRGD